MVGGHGDPFRVPESLLAEFETIVGRSNVITDPDLIGAFSTDWSGRFVGATPVVVRPGSSAEVAEVLNVCATEGIRVVPQGGNTGLVGGGVPLRGELVLNLLRLTRIDAVDVAEAKVTVGAGVRLAVLQRHAADAGMAYPVDLGSRESATLGGTIATNAGGMHVIRWGGTRAQVAGIEAVLADGTIIEHLGGLTKDNTGYDLAGLLCGSEGTLAVITTARMRLVPDPGSRAVALLALDDVAGAVDASLRLRRKVPEVTAIELILGEGVELVCESESVAPPFNKRWPVHLLVEVATERDAVGVLTAGVVDVDGIKDAALAEDVHGRQALWSYRELMTLAINRIGPPHKLDVSIPLDKIAAFVGLVPEVVAEVAPGASTWLFGHLGDGNIHVNVTGVDPADVAIDDAVFGLVASMGGSISAEHGIGTAKKRWLHLNRSKAEIGTFRRIKSALDPGMILNPNALLP